MKMQNLLSFFAAAAVALFVSACGDSKAPASAAATADNSNAGKTAKKVIGISIPSADHGWTGGVVFWADQAKKQLEAADQNLEVIVSSAKDPSEQMDKVENLLVRGIDALVILPHEPAPLTNICAKAAKKGVKLVVVDRNLTKDVQDLSVVGDNPGFGRAAAEAMAKELNGKGNIVVMEGVLCQVNSDRVNAFNEVMKKYPDIKILESRNADWDTGKGLTLMENYLQKYKEIDGVWTGDDDVLIGALKAYQESKRDDVKVFIGGGGSKTIVKRILDGDKLVRLTVTYPPKMIFVGAQEAVKLVKGEVPADKKVVVPAEIIDAANARENYFPDSAY